ncbi:MAG TPA: toll/interleukin-1 receptor domain-containing protein [Thermoanaerobaculia bacterium]|nr:toll/interleukin-1 receptor domain-containing protein [Thermoanaerobaculia bacterium]
MSEQKSVIISYKTANRAMADEFYAELKSAGLSPWMDYRGIEPGTKWRPKLLEELRSCGSFVALLTPGYIQSETCRMEIFIARSRGCVVLPVVLEDCFDLLDEYEETKGLADTFMVRLYRLSVVGLSITRQEAIQRVITAARSVGQEPARKTVYVAYCNNEAELATQIARQLERDGISAWVATEDCRVGDNWRQAQARGVLNASIQVVVLDESIAEAEVLRTEILLAEAFGLPVFTVLGAKLAGDEEAVAHVMERLRVADRTFGRLTDMQPFRCDQQSLLNFSKRIKACISSTT